MRGSRTPVGDGEVRPASLRLTDFDYAVLAAARIGALTPRTVATRYIKNQPVTVIGWVMGDVRVDASIQRLERAGELISLGGGALYLLFPGDRGFEVIRQLRRGRKQ